MSTPKYPNAPCHWWPNLTPEDANENEIELIHKIAGNPMDIRGMTWEQARNNYRICAQDIRELVPSPAPHLKETGGDSAILEAWRGWFAMHTSGENCMNTIVDVFTAMRDQLEDTDVMLSMIRAAMLAHPTPNPTK